MWHQAHGQHFDEKIVALYTLTTILNYLVLGTLMLVFCGELLKARIIMCRLKCLYFTDNECYWLCMSSPKKGRHHRLHDDDTLDYMQQIPMVLIITPCWIEYLQSIFVLRVLSHICIQFDNRCLAPFTWLQRLKI